ncbi:MAG: cobalt ECF transporter T component CbiQ [Acidimicrobiales bacterium]
MAAGHGVHAHAMLVEGDSPVHRLPAAAKIVAALLFVLAVVATPREAGWAFGTHLAVLAVVVALARVPPGLLARRLAIELPFVAFAVLLPVVGGGERVAVVGVSLSVEGLWGAWNILAKATLGLFATLLLTATTSIADLIGGLDRLRVPRAFTAIAGFMVRYADVVADDMRRMRIARLSRGHDPRWFWQARAVASSAGALFIRTYERGERVHAAMLSRGYTGALPRLGEQPTGRDWAVALVVPAMAAVTCVAAWGWVG